jgi:hypothetical protein
MNIDFTELKRKLVQLPQLSKREVFTLVALHAILSVDPDKRSGLSASSLAVQAADKTLATLKDRHE